MSASKRNDSDNVEKDEKDDDLSENDDDKAAAESELEDDPLSDVWDSDDDDEPDNMHNGSDEDGNLDVSSSQKDVPGHKYMTKRVGKSSVRIDMTPPNILLTEAQAMERKYYKKHMADECIRECVRALTLVRIVYGDEAKWKLAEWHTNLAKAYWELKEYPAQTTLHAEQARNLLLQVDTSAAQPVQNRYVTEETLAFPQRFELLELSLQVFYLLGKALLATKKYSEAQREFQKCEQILIQRSRDKSAPTMKNKSFWRTEILSALAKTNECLQKPQDAIACLEEMRELLEKRYGGESPKLVGVYQQIAKLEHAKGRDANHEYAIETASHAHKLAKATYGENSEAAGDAARILANAHGRADIEDGKILAESYLNEALDCYRSIKPVTTELTKKILRTQEELARLLGKDRPTEAIATMQSSLPNTYEDVFGEQSVELADAYKLTARFQLQAGNASEGARMLRKCLDIETHLFGGGENSTNSRVKNTREALRILLQNPNLRTVVGDAPDEKLKSRPRFSTNVKLGGEEKAAKKQSSKF